MSTRSSESIYGKGSLGIGKNVSTTKLNGYRVGIDYLTVDHTHDEYIKITLDRPKDTQTMIVNLTITQPKGDVQLTVTGLVEKREGGVGANPIGWVDSKAEFTSKTHKPVCYTYYNSVGRPIIEIANVTLNANDVISIDSIIYSGATNEYDLSNPSHVVGIDLLSKQESVDALLFKCLMIDVLALDEPYILETMDYLTVDHVDNDYQYFGIKVHRDTKVCNVLDMQISFLSALEFEASFYFTYKTIISKLNRITDKLRIIDGEWVSLSRCIFKHPKTEYYSDICPFSYSYNINNQLTRDYLQYQDQLDIQVHVNDASDPTKDIVRFRIPKLSDKPISVIKLMARVRINSLYNLHQFREKQYLKLSWS